MNIKKTILPGVLIIEPEIHNDERGCFAEVYKLSDFVAEGISCDFVQDNVSRSSKKGTFRGLHWQNPPYAQSKLVTCTRGRILDIAVDIRKNSPTFGSCVCAELSEENMAQLFIPKGFAHGFLTLTDDVEFRYKCDNEYNKESEGCANIRSLRVSSDEIKHILEKVEFMNSRDENAPDIFNAVNEFVLGVNC